MGRPRAFDEEQAIQAAAELFASHGYEATSVDDLVGKLGVHRGSLYKVFGSKRGLYLTALRRHIDQQVLPQVAALANADNLGQMLISASETYDSGPAAGFLLLAAAELAPHDPDVAALVERPFAALDDAIAQALIASGERSEAARELAPTLSATVTGLRLRSRALPSAASESSERSRPVQALAARIASPTADLSPNKLPGE